REGKRRNSSRATQLEHMGAEAAIIDERIHPRLAYQNETLPFAFYHPKARVRRALYGCERASILPYDHFSRDASGRGHDEIHRAGLVLEDQSVLSFLHRFEIFHGRCPAATRVEKTFLWLSRKRIVRDRVSLEASLVPDPSAHMPQI